MVIARAGRWIRRVRRDRFEQGLADGERAELERVQRRRIDAHLAFARTHSPFYAKRYSGLSTPSRLSDVPIVTKSDLVAAYDDWSTDRRVTFEAVSRFTADPDRIGELFLGMYAVAVSTGSTGSRSIHVRDAQWQRVYHTLAQTRFRTQDGALGRDPTVAYLSRTDAHFAMYSDWSAGRRGLPPGVEARQQVFPLSTPIDVLVDQLNEFQPDILGGPPSILEELAFRRSEGSLRIRPHQVHAGTESLSPEVAAAIGAAFGCPVRDRYTTTEAKFIAFGCDQGWLHVNEDWVVLEPVDDDMEPVEPGVPSAAVLMTELANQVQPLIRYRVNDAVTVRPDPCECGNPLMPIRVIGKRYEVLRFRGSAATTGAIHSAALDPVIRAHGVERYRLAATETALRVKVDLDEAPPETLAVALRHVLDGHGLGFVDVVVAASHEAT